jgi:hydrogenase maturation protease
MNTSSAPDLPDTACHPSGDSPADDAPIVVLGIGNVLWADEGFGVRCVEALQQHWDFAPHVELVDGGTQGLYLIQHVQSARKLLILDAVDYGLAPGTLHQVENEEVPRFLGAKKMSLHQTGFQEVLMLAQLTERYPEQVLLIGCQPEELEDYGGSLRPCVRQAVDDAVALAVDRLRAWGAQPRPRAQALGRGSRHRAHPVHRGLRGRPPRRRSRLPHGRRALHAAPRHGRLRRDTMCIGLPMQVLATRPGFATVTGRGETREVNTALVGERSPATGCWSSSTARAKSSAPNAPPRSTPRWT